MYDVQFADEVRHDQDTMTTGQVLANSSNVGVALLIDRITDEKFYDYMVDFGIGSPTALDFPGESSGILHDLDDWSGVSKPFAGIGYGYSATPLQMLRAYNVFANDGVLVEPHVVAQVRSSEGCLLYTSPSPRDRTRSRMPSSA